MYESSMLGGYGVGFIIAAALAIWVATDANKRGMSGIVWGLGVFFLCIPFFPIYLIVRKPLLAQPYGYPPAPPPAPSQPYGYQPGPAASPPPSPPPVEPTQPPHHFCSNCGTQVTAGAKFCPSCGRAV